VEECEKIRLILHKFYKFFLCSFDMNKRYLYIILGIVVIVIIGVVLMLLRVSNGGEDNWIRDSNGVYIKHGNPSAVPDNVAKQQFAINCAKLLYNNAVSSGMEFDSQCLGVCGEYSVDIVHVPRTPIDDIEQNQCIEFKEGKTKSFIELDKKGELFRVVD
jgi:hypothetical protein